MELLSRLFPKPEDEHLKKKDQDGGNFVADSPDFEISILVIAVLVNIAAKADEAKSNGYRIAEKHPDERKRSRLPAIPRDILILPKPSGFRIEAGCGR